MAAVILAALEALMPLIQNIPSLIAEVQALMAGLDPKAPTVTPAQLAAYNAILVQANAAVQAS